MVVAPLSYEEREEIIEAAIEEIERTIDKVLKKSIEDQDLEKKIKEVCTGSCKYVESSWIVKYSGNADSLSGELRK